MKAGRHIAVNLVTPCLGVLLFFVPFARAEWYDATFPFRRELNVTWDADHQGDDGEIAVAEFYTGGHQLPSGQDVRVVTEDGQYRPTHILKVGPGDTVRLIFQLSKLQRRYYAYWGNPQPQPLPKNVATDVPIRFGLLFEMRGLGRENAEGFEQLQAVWERGTPDYGATMIDRPFIGYNPLTDSDRTIDRITGMLFAPQDGVYLFAGACHDKGALFIDGKPLLLIPGSPGDIRFNQKIQLTRGRHAFLLYHANYAGSMIISIGWKQPGSEKVEIINRESFGICARGNPGRMEEIKKSLTADFKAEYVGECFEHNPSTPGQPERGNYSHHYRFTAIVPKDNPAMKIEWDFGDGQSAEGAIVDHVFLTDGVYPVRLIYRLGQSSDAQTNKVLVQRDYSRGDRPLTDEAAIQSKMIAGYDTSSMPVNWLPWATILHARSGQTDAMRSTATRLATEPHHGDPSLAYDTLLQITRGANAGAHPEDLAQIWSKVPRDSDLQPRAVNLLSNVLLWETGDFARAVSSLQPFSGGKAPAIARRYAQALLLTGKTDEARKILKAQPIEGPPEREAAVSGALARTVEFFITQKEVEAGEDAWERWQARYPADFLNGYSVLLRVRLIELAGHAGTAAKVAEAFARAVPNSSYAPQLLDRASKLTATTDPAKSQALRATLKERYPEDPLSQ